MHNEIEIVIGLLFVVSVLAIVANRVAVPYPILLVLCGLGIGIAPGLPKVELEPDLVFLLFLPPLLTAAAWNTSWRDFRANIRSISLLAIGLVLATTVVVAIAAHTLIPGVPWAVAFTLGAIISPPDAVAATAITQRLKVPEGIITVLEGESLVNDATGLVAYRFAVATVTMGTFSLWEAGTQFFVMAIGGVLVGLGLGWVVVWIHRQIDDSLVEITTTLLACYAVYLIAEKLHVSGVLAVVANGIYHRWYSPQVLTPATRIQAIAVWNTVVFMLNGLIFVLIGLQLPSIMAVISAQALPVPALIGQGILISLVVIIVRILWVFPGAYLPHWFIPQLRVHEGFPVWQQVAIVAWTGMRGVVSLAAALSLPVTLASGAPFPARDMVIFLTFCVILVTLVFQGLTLPFLIRVLKVSEQVDSDREEMEARRCAAEAALARLEELMQENTALAEADLAKWMQTQYQQRVRQYCALCDAMDIGNDEQVLAFQRLQREVVSTERQTVVRLRNQGVISDTVLQRIERELDLEEARLAS